MRRGVTKGKNIKDKCVECENENFLKVADLEIKCDRLEYYNKILIACLDTKDELCKALREDNEQLRNKLEVTNNDG